MTLLSDIVSLRCSWSLQELCFKGTWELGFGVWRKVWSAGVDWDVASLVGISEAHSPQKLVQGR